jgi:hypothetical protein
MSRVHRNRAQQKLTGMYAVVGPDCLCHREVTSVLKRMTALLLLAGVAESPLKRNSQQL